MDVPADKRVGPPTRSPPDCGVPRGTGARGIAALNDNPAHFIGGQCAPAQLVLKHYGKAWAVAWCDQSNNIFHNADA